MYRSGRGCYSRGGCACVWRHRIYRKSLNFLFNFAVNLRLLKRNKIYLKRGGAIF